MTLTKREKILLQFVVCLAFFAVILVFLVLPQLDERNRLSAERDNLSLEHQEKETLLKNTLLDGRYDEAMAQAKENYNYFYSVLNSYTIDGIVNALMQEYGLSVFNLKISDYEDATYDFQKLEEAELKVLVRSNVNLTVSGSYQNILSFIEALNEKSPCLSVDMVSISENSDDATGSQSMTAAFRIYIYGIDVKIEGLDILQ